MSIALLLFPDFLLIAAGTWLRRLPSFPAEFWVGVERLVYFVLFPALLFRSLATISLGADEMLRLLCVAFGYTLGGMAFSALGRLVLRVDQPTFAACFQCGFRVNAYVGLAVAASVGGEAGVVLVSLIIGAVVPLVNFAAVSMLAQGQARRIAIELARNPLILGCAAGVLWRATGLPLPDFVVRTLAHLASAALPLGLLAVGAGLRFGGTGLPWSGLAWWNGGKLVVMPMVALVLAQVFGLPPLERKMAVLMAAVPTATSAYILANQMNGRGAPVALLISSGTLLAVLTLPLWLAVVS